MKDTSRRIKLYIRGAVLLGALLLWVCSPVVKSWLSGMIMLFTQRSVQALQGNINSSSLPVLAVLKQSAFHSAVMFFLPPRQIVAAVACLGIFRGTVLSLIGSLAGAGVWYWLLYPVVNKQMLKDRLPAPGITGGITGVLACIWGPVMGICAVLKLPFLRCVSGMAAMGLAVTLMYALLCSPFSALLPGWAVLCLRIAGIALLAVCVLRFIKKQPKQ